MGRTRPTSSTSLSIVNRNKGTMRRGRMRGRRHSRLGHKCRIDMSREKQNQAGNPKPLQTEFFFFVFLWLPGWVFQSRLQRKEAEKQEDDASPCRRIHPFSFSHGSVSLHFLVQEGQLAKVESYDGRFMRPLVWRERASHEEKGRRTRGPSISLCSTV